MNLSWHINCSSFIKLERYTKNEVLGLDVYLGMLAGRTPGFVGADLANMINETALLVAKNDKEKEGAWDKHQTVSFLVKNKK